MQPTTSTTEPSPLLGLTKHLQSCLNGYWLLQDIYCGAVRIYTNAGSPFWWNSQHPDHTAGLLLIGDWRIIMLLDHLGCESLLDPDGIKEKAAWGLHDHYVCRYSVKDRQWHIANRSPEVEGSPDRIWLRGTRADCLSRDIQRLWEPEIFC